jgi:hypothetical protein
MNTIKTAYNALEHLLDIFHLIALLYFTHQVKKHFLIHC